MRDSTWHGETQAHYRQYSLAELRHIREDATAAAKVATGIQQNDYLDMALYASQELKRRQDIK